MLICYLSFSSNREVILSVPSSSENNKNVKAKDQVDVKNTLPSIIPKSKDKVTNFHNILTILLI